MPRNCNNPFLNPHSDIKIAIIYDNWRLKIYKTCHIQHSLGGFRPPKLPRPGALAPGSQAMQVPLWQSSLLKTETSNLGKKRKKREDTMKKTINKTIKNKSKETTYKWRLAALAATYMAAALTRRRHVCGSIYVFSLCFVLFLFAFLFFVCAARDLCHNGTCVAWDPGARAPGPGGLGGWKPPRECWIWQVSCIFIINYHNLNIKLS